MNNWRENRIESAVDGSNPTVLARLKSGFAVIADTQFLPGYCVLLAYPKVSSLNEMEMADRLNFLADMTAIGDAIIKVYQPLRLNYEILCNRDTYLHAHIFPRYSWEDERILQGPVWQYPAKNWQDPIPAHQFDHPNHWENIEALKKELAKYNKEQI